MALSKGDSCYSEASNRKVYRPRIELVQEYVNWYIEIDFKDQL
jgi:hypothetical protein